MQRFRVASNTEEARAIPKEFPCEEYVIKAQVLAGGRGKGHFDNGFKVGSQKYLVGGMGQSTMIILEQHRSPDKHFFLGGSDNLINIVEVNFE